MPGARRPTRPPSAPDSGHPDSSSPGAVLRPNYNDGSMHMTTRGLFPAAVLAAVVGLGGCYEDNDVIVHEQGDYKGMRDPLQDPKATAEREETLAKRFSLVQVDR